MLRAACLLEATARKPGNVHPQASFADLTYGHFCRSADAAAPILARTAELGVGRAIRTAVRATRDVAHTNVNLGIILLLAPLAAVPPARPLATHLADILTRLSVEDACHVYDAIRLANPGGLGQTPEQDVAESPTGTLLEVMTLAADRDRIARQYANNFADVLDFGVPLLARYPDFAERWETAIIHLQLELLAQFTDSLIARKCGPELAADASVKAERVLKAGWPDFPQGRQALQRFDRWLRADGNRRNPGTTADLVAACLFAALRERLISLPEWTRLEAGPGKLPQEGTGT